MKKKKKKKKGKKIKQNRISLDLIGKLIVKFVHLFALFSSSALSLLLRILKKNFFFDKSNNNLN